MRQRLLLGPFYPGWPAPLRLVLEVEDGVVRSVECQVVGRVDAPPEGWAGLLPAEGLARIERVCAGGAWAHTLAYVQAMEQLAGLRVPIRAQYLRVLFAEMERIVAHLWSASLLLQRVGWTTVAAAFVDLAEEVVRTREALAGRRFFLGLNQVGGLREDVQDLEAVSALVARLKGPLYRLAHQVIVHRPTVADLVGVGLLTKEAAEEDNLSGPAARASELERDLRLDRPYAAYAALDAQVVTQGGGDVFARWMVWVLEVFESLRLLEEAVSQIPDGPVRGAESPLLPAGEAEARVECPRGALALRVQVDEDGRLGGLWRTTPGQAHLTALPRTLVGQALDYVGVIVSSWGLCPACLGR